MTRISKNANLLKDFEAIAKAWS